MTTQNNFQQNTSQSTNSNEPLKIIMKKIYDLSYIILSELKFICLVKQQNIKKKETIFNEENGGNYHCRRLINISYRYSITLAIEILMESKRIPNFQLDQLIEQMNVQFRINFGLELNRTSGYFGHLFRIANEQINVNQSGQQTIKEWDFDANQLGIFQHPSSSMQMVPQMNAYRHPPMMTPAPNLTLTLNHQRASPTMHHYNNFASAIPPNIDPQPMTTYSPQAHAQARPNFQQQLQVHHKPTNNMQRNSPSQAYVVTQSQSRPVQLFPPNSYSVNNTINNSAISNVPTSFASSIQNQNFLLMDQRAVRQSQQSPSISSSSMRLAPRNVTQLNCETPKSNVSSNNNSSNTEQLLPLISPENNQDIEIIPVNDLLTNSTYVSVRKSTNGKPLDTFNEHSKRKIPDEGKQNESLQTPKKKIRDNHSEDGESTSETMKRPSPKENVSDAPRPNRSTATESSAFVETMDNNSTEVEVNVTSNIPPKKGTDKNEMTVDDATLSSIDDSAKVKVKVEPVDIKKEIDQTSSSGSDIEILSISNNFNKQNEKREVDHIDLTEEVSDEVESDDVDTQSESSATKFSKYQCFVCSSKAYFICASCYVCTYCSNKCQQQNIEQHSLYCKNFRIEPIENKAYYVK